MKKLAFAILAVGLLTATGAWASMFVSNDVKSAQRARGTGSSFTRLLHRQYTALASEALKESDHLHARRYVNKALSASGGAEPAPENPARWFVPSRARKPLAGGYVRLMKALPAGRGENPAAAARAQAMFDCWVEEEHEDIWMRVPVLIGPNLYQPRHIARCKDAFWAAIRELEGGGAADYIIFFAFDRSNLDRDARGIANEVIAAAKARSNARVSIFGFTDRSGSSSYNLGLSKRRAASVVNALTKAGVASTRINSSGFGETRLRVMTADGVRHPMNRRAEITIR